MESENRDWEKLEWMIEEKGMEWTLENYKTTSLIREDLDEDKEFLKLKKYFFQHRDLMAFYIAKKVEENS